MSSLYDALKCVAEEYAAAQTGADLLAGRVTGTDPLCVELSPGLTVSQEEGFLSVARHLTQYDLDVDLRLSGAAMGERSLWITVSRWGSRCLSSGPRAVSTMWRSTE